MSDAEHDKPQSDTIFTTFGRMNPPTTGHLKLAHHIANLAKRHNADHQIFLSHSHDPKKNPLSYHEKVHFAKKMMPHAHIEKTPDVKSPIDMMKHLEKKGYKHVHVVVGSDRAQEMHNLLHRYNGKEYHLKSINIHSAGHRDPDAEGVAGMSASKMRAHATAGEFDKFKRGVPRKEHAKDLYHAVRHGLKLECINIEDIWLVFGEALRSYLDE